MQLLSELTLRNLAVYLSNPPDFAAHTGSRRFLLKNKRRAAAIGFAQ